MNAEASAEKLKEIPFDKVVSSDLGRAVATAEIITRSIGFTEEVERSDGLREVSYGDFANQPYSVAPQLTALENADFVAPHGESLAVMQKRVMETIHKIAVANPDATILIVAHDGTINAVRATYNNESIGIADLTRNPHDGVVRFEYDGDHVASFEVL